MRPIESARDQQIADRADVQFSMPRPWKSGSVKPVLACHHFWNLCRNESLSLVSWAKICRRQRAVVEAIRTSFSPNCAGQLELARLPPHGEDGHEIGALCDGSAKVSASASAPVTASLMKPMRRLSVRSLVPGTAESDSVAPPTTMVRDCPGPAV